MPIRIAIADVGPLIRAALAAELGAHEDLLLHDCVADGQAIVELVRRDRPDVVVLDIDMPGMSGIEAARQVRDASPGTRIVFLSARTADADVEGILGVEANGYVIKDEPVSALLSAIRGAMRGRAWYPAAVRESLVFDESGVSLSKAGAPERRARTGGSTAARAGST